MTYTKSGPFTDGSATHPINAAFLNNVETTLVSTETTANSAASAAAAAQTAASAAQSTANSAFNTASAVNSSNVRSPITGWFHASAFGAVGDGTTNDAGAIQAAINAAHTAYTATYQVQTVFLQAVTYAVGPVPFYQSNGSQDGICSLKLLDGVEIVGYGAAIHVLNSSYGTGAYYAIVRSISEGLSNAGIRGVLFDGNRANNISSTNAGNILLEALSNVWVKDVVSIESNGNGIMIRGNAYGSFGTNIRITDCWVKGVNGIGIQAAQFNGLLISGNRVESTSDNCIDVYGEYGTTSTTSHGQNFQINNNNCLSGATGIFLETVAYGVIVGNRVTQCSTGLRTNRINGQPTSLNIRANGFFGCAVGAAFSGVMQAVSFIGNEVQAATTACIQFDGANTAGILGSDNVLNGNSTSVPLILATSACSALSQCYIVRTITLSASSPTYVTYAGSVSNCTFATANGPGF